MFVTKSFCFGGRRLGKHQQVLRVFWDEFGAGHAAGFGGLPEGSSIAFGTVGGLLVVPFVGD